MEDNVVLVLLNETVCSIEVLHLLQLDSASRYLVCSCSTWLQWVEARCDGEDTHFMENVGCGCGFEVECHRGV